MKKKKKRFKLKELLTIGNGKDYSSLGDGIYPVYGSGGFMRSVDSYLYEGESVLLPRKGTLSNIQFVSGKFWTVDTCYYSKINKSIVLPYYLFRLLRSFDLSGFDSGASIPSMTSKTYYSIKIDLPDIMTQKKISNVLLRYDKLIEVNNSRIKALEKIAENLYKEWFVRFRFPGYENTEFENGIPKGWEICRFSSIANILSGGTPKTEHEEYFGGQIPFYTPKDSAENFFVFDTITKLTDDGLCHCNSQLFPQNTIMITARGTVGNLNLLAVPMAMNQSCYALNSDTISSQYFLFFLIKREIQKLKKMASGGVFDTIIVNTFDHIKVLLPTNGLINKFDCVASSITKEVYSLSKQNINLIKQRDLLLPRLMSGKLEV